MWGSTIYIHAWFVHVHNANQNTVTEVGSQRLLTVCDTSADGCFSNLHRGRTERERLSIDGDIMSK